MQIRTGSIDFSLPLRGSGPRPATQTIVFPRTVLRAVAGLGGYTLGYSGGDHNVGRMDIRLDTTVNANTVEVGATLGLRDWSGNWDDDYDGTVEFVVLADLEPANTTPPRGDLIVTGMEFNQAVQYYRAASYLDPANVQPDNSIWQVARKNTGVRVYADWDDSAGLAPIVNLTGELTVQTAGTTLTLQAINNAQHTISPRRDAQINLAEADHTLNFMIPAAWCVGSVTITCQLWDQAAPNSRSAPHIRTIVFTEVEPLNLYLVGINYNAVAPALPAPSQADISVNVVSLIKVYPVGDVIQTGYTTLDFDESVVGNVGDGCGSGLNHLLDALDDLRGGSDDIYLGTLPAGILNTPGNSVGGCAPQGGKTAATFVDYEVSAVGDVPHEVGHALDRHHAPCSSGCSVAPADPDPNFPRYGSFRSDSIGVFGFDPTSNTVFNPAMYSDFMAYHFPQWVSAYTYNGLRGSSFQPTAGTAPGPAMHFREDVEFEILWLGLSIARDRTVSLRPSFHFSGHLLNRSRCGQFIAELQDANRQPLSCTALHCDCDAGCDCWPRTIRDRLPLPAGSKWLVIWEGNTKIFEEQIAVPPKVKIDKARSSKKGIDLAWSAKVKGLWYLVQWFDEPAGAWRGVAPRQQSTSLHVSPQLLSRSPTLQLRVLATAQLGTGTAETTVKLANPAPPSLKITLTGIGDGADKPLKLPAVLHATVLDSAGREWPADRMTWYANGYVIGRGKQADLRALELGRANLRLVCRGLERSIGRSWIIERRAEGFVLHHQMSDPEPHASNDDRSRPRPVPDDPSNL